MATRNPLIRNLAALCVLLMITVAALALGWYSAARANDAVAQARAAATQAKQAAQQAKAVASRANQIAACINTDLGKLSKPTAKDAAAHIGFAEAVKSLFDVPPNATAAERVAIAKRFQRQVNHYVDQLVADQRSRERSPLGRC